MSLWLVYGWCGCFGSVTLAVRVYDQLGMLFVPDIIANAYFIAGMVAITYIRGTNTSYNSVSLSSVTSCQGK